MKRRVAILISGRGSNMAALIQAAAADRDFPAEIALVISNVAGAGGLAIAQQNGVPTAVVESKPFGKDRLAFEAKLQEVLDALVDLRAETKRAPRIVTNMGAANPTAAGGD